MAAAARLQRLDVLLQRDPGNRGVAALHPASDFAQAAAHIAPCKHVAILTGFPCLIDNPVPSETDGPPGALALAIALRQHADSQATVVTDAPNRVAVEACLAGQGVPIALYPPEGAPLRVGTREEAEERAGAFLRDTLKVDGIIAIERAGRSADGIPYTMRGRDMTHLTGDMDVLLEVAMTRGVKAVAIGDGGNELGLGKVRPFAERDLPSFLKYVDSVSADHVVVCGVSNWGGYALGAAIQLVRGDVVLPVDVDEQREALKRMNAIGSADGSTGDMNLSVDGFPFDDVHAGIIREINTIAGGGDGDVAL